MGLENEVLAHLATQFRRAQVILLTGAGFSTKARNIRGEPLPTAPELRRALWELSFPGEPLDEGSSIQDLFEYALGRKRGDLVELLRRTLTVDSSNLPEEYGIWFSLPWYRVYTLNTDDLAAAVARKLTLPWPLCPISATRTTEAPRQAADGLEVVHLNGTLEDIPDNVTFSTTQYAERLARQEPWYARCVADIVSHPVVFVGTRLDEPPLWQHLEFRRSRGGRELRELRPKSYLVTPSLDRPRKELLRLFNIVHVPMSMEEFTREGLTALADAAEEGKKAVAVIKRRVPGGSPVRRIPCVAALAQGSPLATTDYLMGEEPAWADLHTGRAIQREVDKELQARLIGELGKSGPKAIFLVTGTAGSGKSTTLMRLALTLSAAGHHVGWIDRTSELSPRDIRRDMDRDDHPGVLFIDDCDLYGGEIADLAREIVHGREYPLVVMGTRSGRADRISDPLRQIGCDFVEVPIPHLTDGDIGGLLDVLDRENRLGILKGKPRHEQEAVFREKAGRQLLVAMIEATSGKRFEDKIHEEVADLEADVREVYQLVAVVTSLRGYLKRDEILLAVWDGSNATLNTLDTLLRRHLLVPAAGGGGSLRGTEWWQTSCSRRWPRLG